MFNLDYKRKTMGNKSSDRKKEILIITSKLFNEENNFTLISSLYQVINAMRLFSRLLWYNIERTFWFHMYIIFVIHTKCWLSRKYLNKFFSSHILNELQILVSKLTRYVKTRPISVYRSNIDSLMKKNENWFIPSFSKVT